MGIKWKKVVKVAVEEAKEFRRVVGVSPTLRALFYRLVSNSTLPNTMYAYKNLSRILSNARKDGSFHWGLLKDESREIIGGDDRGADLDSLEYWYEKIMDKRFLELRKALNKMDVDAPIYTLNKWCEQPERVIILLEKNALADAVESFIGHWYVETFVMRGYASTTSMKKLADKIKEYDANVHLIVLTDFDPSGEDIVRFVHKTLSEFDVDCSIEKVAVNQQQIEKYCLPSKPEASKEREKMERDTRFNAWEHGFFRVELDALLSFVPDEFKRILNESIEKHYNPEIMTSLQKRRTEARHQSQKIIDFYAVEVQQIQEVVSEYLSGVEDDDEY